MDSPEREACLHCGEPVALDARICPHCSRSALVLVALPGTVPDARLRYQVARALAAKAVQLGPVNGVTAMLGSPRPRLGPLTRSAAYRALETLQGLGLSAEFESEGQPRPRSPLVWAAGGALLLVAAGAWLAFRSPGASAPPASERAVDKAAPVEAAAATPSRAPRPALSARDVAGRTLPSTVLLSCPNSIGSGFVAAPETVLTNAHVLCGPGTAPSVTTPDGETYAAGVLTADSGIDLAALRVPGLRARALELADATTLAPGDRVIIVGNPMGLEFTVSEGIVSSVSQLLLGVSYIQTDARINPGNSGGPLVDGQGRVVGVVSLKLQGGEGIGFALPINYAWDHSPPFVPAPAEVDAAGWQSMVQRARAQNDELTSAASAALSMPVLVTAGADGYGRLVVRLGRISSFPPGFEEITVRVRRGEEVVCTLKGDVSEWKAVPGGRTPFEHDPRLRAWLDANSLGQGAYTGESPLRWDQCPREQMRSGVVIELQGGNPEASRLQLN